MIIHELFVNNLPSNHDDRRAFILRLVELAIIEPYEAQELLAMEWNRRPELPKGLCSGEAIREGK